MGMWVPGPNGQQVWQSDGPFGGMTGNAGQTLAGVNPDGLKTKFPGADGGNIWGNIGQIGNFATGLAGLFQAYNSRNDFDDQMAFARDQAAKEDAINRRNTGLQAEGLAQARGITRNDPRFASEVAKYTV